MLRGLVLTGGVLEGANDGRVHLDLLRGRDTVIDDGSIWNILAVAHLVLRVLVTAHALLGHHVVVLVIILHHITRHHHLKVVLLHEQVSIHGANAELRFGPRRFRKTHFLLLDSCLILRHFLLFLLLELLEDQEAMVGNGAVRGVLEHSEVPREEPTPVHVVRNDWLVRVNGHLV